MRGGQEETFGKQFKRKKGNLRGCPLFQWHRRLAGADPPI